MLQFLTWRNQISMHPFFGFVQACLLICKKTNKSGVVPITSTGYGKMSETTSLLWAPWYPDGFYQIAIERAAPCLFQPFQVTSGRAPDEQHMMRMMLMDQNLICFPSNCDFRGKIEGSIQYFPIFRHPSCLKMLRGWGWWRRCWCWCAAMYRHWQAVMGLCASLVLQTHCNWTLSLWVLLVIWCETTDHGKLFDMIAANMWPMFFELFRAWTSGLVNVLILNINHQPKREYRTFDIQWSQKVDTHQPLLFTIQVLIKGLVCEMVIYWVWSSLHTSSDLSHIQKSTAQQPPW